MKIECNKEKLGKALSQLEKIASKNLTLPVLSCIIFDANSDKLILKATNLEIAVVVNIDANILEPGIAAVPAHAITSYIAQIDQNKNVSIKSVANNVEINSGGNKTIIKAQNHEDFPTIPTFEPDETLDLKNKIFLEGIKSVIWSAAQSSMKPELSSIYIYPEDNQLVFVATDSFRLAEKKVKIKISNPDFSVLIPVKNANDILRILDNDIENVKIEVSKNQISFKTNDLFITSRVIEGTFPDYKQIVPKDFKTEITALKQDIVKNFKLATIFSDKFNKLHISLDVPKNNFQIKTSNNDIGETESKIDSVSKGDSLEVNFNYKYIIDAINTIESNSIEFKFNQHNKLIIKGVGDNSFMYLVMPMNR